MPKLITILFGSDLHLGKRSYGLTERIRDHAAVLPQIAAYAHQRRPDWLVLGGDVFDNPAPDSFSSDAFRRFLEGLPLHNLSVVALTGNHDRERLDLGMTRVRSLAGDQISSDDDLASQERLAIKAFDWMPAAAIARELEKLSTDDPVDILCLHQSVEGLKPEIGEPEVRLEQLRGKARLVLAGDVHVNKTVDAGEGTTVLSAGSTEMCASDEDPRKVVKLITYDAEAHTLVSVEDLPLDTRQPCWWNVRTDIEFDVVLSGMDGGMPANQRTIHFLTYAPEFAHRLPELDAAAARHGDLLVATPAAPTEEVQSFSESKISASREFEQVLAERHADEIERTAVLSLWRDPEHATAILEALKIP